MDKIRIVLDNGTHRDFNTRKVLTKSDVDCLVSDVLTFVKVHGERKYARIAAWFPVEGHEIIDNTTPV